MPNKVTIDEYRRIFLNGEPWFPICFTPFAPPLGAKDPTGRDAIEVLAEGGVDSFRIGRGHNDPSEDEECQKYLDWFAEYGVYGWPYIADMTVFDPKHPERKERLRQFVERFREHPALAIYKTMDEPAWGKHSIPGMLAAYRYLKQIDPDHPAWMVHAPRDTVELLTKYCKACDIAGIDIYPISVPMGLHSHLPNKNISVVGDYADFINSAVRGKKPFFMVLQVCWSGVTPPKRILVMPTFHQERYMAYQAIIKGARGLVFFGMPVALQGKNAELGYNWTFWEEVLRPLLSEFKKGTELYSALVAPPSNLPLSATGAPDIEFTTRKVGPNVYIFAAKRESAEVPVTFLGDFLDGDIEVLFENRAIKARGGSFTDSFGPNDVHVYKFCLS
ncbi:MAG: hypothetical protein K6T99_03535 [Armatimonadetes bacterium]|nr:hypothetical protein [Armatimonadota bacterium]